MLKMENVIRTTIVTCMFISSLAHASDSEHKKNLNAKSMSQGMAVAEVELLEVEEGPGRGAVFESVLGTGHESLNLTDGQENDIEIEEEYTTVTGDGWHMTIWEDGNKVEMMNYGGFEKKKKEIKEKKKDFVNTKISQRRLEKIGREFIC